MLAAFDVAFAGVEILETRGCGVVEGVGVEGVGRRERVLGELGCGGVSGGEGDSAGTYTCGG